MIVLPSKLHLIFWISQRIDIIVKRRGQCDLLFFSGIISFHCNVKLRLVGYAVNVLFKKYVLMVALNCW